MHPLIGNFIALCIVGFFCTYPRTTKSGTRLFIFICFVLLLFFRAFVDVMSVPDLNSYQLGFEQLLNIPFLDVPSAPIYYVKISEAGFRYLMKVCGYISSSFTVFLLIYGVLWLKGYLRVIKEFTPKYIVLSLLFLTVGQYEQSIFVIRQHLAMLVVFLSYRYIIRNDLKRYLLMMLLAYSLHHSALIAFPLYFLYNLRKKNLWLAFIVLCGVAYFTKQNFTSLVENDAFHDYDSYILDKEAKTNASMLLLLLLQFVAYVFFLRKKVLDIGINRILFISLSVAIIISFFGMGINPTSRVAMYFTDISFLTIPIIAENISDNPKRYFVVLCFFALDTYLAFYGSGFLSFTNYKTIL